MSGLGWGVRGLGFGPGVHGQKGGPGSGGSIVFLLSFLISVLYTLTSECLKEKHGTHRSPQCSRHRSWYRLCCSRSASRPCSRGIPHCDSSCCRSRHCCGNDSHRLQTNKAQSAVSLPRNKLVQVFFFPDLQGNLQTSEITTFGLTANTNFSSTEKETFAR